MTKEEKIKKISETIEPSSFGEDGDGFPLKLILLGNVLDWQYRNDHMEFAGRSKSMLRVRIVERRDLYTEPIEEQSEECIDFILSLVEYGK